MGFVFTKTSWRNRFGMSFGGGGGGYDYGWPGAAAFEPNVIGQWKMDEVAGNIVDEVSSVTLTANGTPLYEVLGAGDWSKFSGITFDGATDWFENGAAQADLNLGANDIVVEIVYNTATAAGNRYVFFHDDNGGPVHGYYCYFTGANFNFTAVATDSSTKALTVASPGDYNDGNDHKIRITADRDGNIEIFFDGVSAGSGDFSTLDGKTINAGQATIGAAIGGVAKFTGTIRELRITAGNLTNNSGGPGGG